MATFEHLYIRLYIFEILPLIENPVDCEISSVIRYLSAKGVKAVEIHRNICKVYGQNIISDGMVRKWVRAFKDLGGKRHDGDSVKTTVLQWLSHQVTNFYHEGIKNLVVRYD